MSLQTILTDKTLKANAKVQAIGKLLLDGKVTLAEFI